MSRISILQTLHNKYFNKWISHYYEDHNYTDILYQDIYIRMFFNGLFYRLKIPTNYFIFKRLSNKSFIIYGDIILMSSFSTSLSVLTYQETKKFNIFLLKHYYYFMPYYVSNFFFNNYVSKKNNIIFKKKNILLNKKKNISSQKKIIKKNKIDVRNKKTQMKSLNNKKINIFKNKFRSYTKDLSNKNKNKKFNNNSLNNIIFNNYKSNSYKKNNNYKYNEKKNNYNHINKVNKKNENDKLIFKTIINLLNDDKKINNIKIKPNKIIKIKNIRNKKLFVKKNYINKYKKLYKKYYINNKLLKYINSYNLFQYKKRKKFKKFKTFKKFKRKKLKKYKYKKYINKLKKRNFLFKNKFFIYNLILLYELNKFLKFNFYFNIKNRKINKIKIKKKFKNLCKNFNYKITYLFLKRYFFKRLKKKNKKRIKLISNFKKKFIILKKNKDFFFNLYYGFLRKKKWKQTYNFLKGYINKYILINNVNNILLTINKKIINYKYKKNYLFNYKNKKINNKNIKLTIFTFIYIYLNLNKLNIKHNNLLYFIYFIRNNLLLNYNILRIYNIKYQYTYLFNNKIYSSFYSSINYNNVLLLKRLDVCNNNINFYLYYISIFSILYILNINIFIWIQLIHNLIQLNYKLFYFKSKIIYKNKLLFLNFNLFLWYNNLINKKLKFKLNILYRYLIYKKIIMIKLKTGIA